MTYVSGTVISALIVHQYKITMKTLLSTLFIFASLYIFSQPAFTWAKQFGGSNNENTRAITTDASGNVYVTGYFGGTTDFDPGAATLNLTTLGQSDIFVCKLDASGNLLWAKQMGGTGEEQPKAIAVDASGNVYTTGSFNSIDADFDPGPGTFTLDGGGFYSDAFVSKLDASGNFIWAVEFSGANDKCAFDITTDVSGNILVTGEFNGAVDFDTDDAGGDLTGNAFDAFIAKLNTAGNLIWVKQMGGANNDRGSCIATDASGNIYSAGMFGITADFDPGPSSFPLTSSGILDIYISKLDASGNFVWAKQMGGAAYDEPTDLKTDGSGNILLSGNFEGTADLDPGAGTSNFTSLGLSDVFVSKLNSSGSLAWTKVFGGSDNDKAFALSSDAGGNVYTIGSFKSAAVDMDPGSGTFNVTGGQMEIFISKLDANGNFSWATSLGGAGDDEGHGIAVDASGNIYATGYFNNTGVDFDPGAGTFSMSSTGDDVFILKLSSTISFVAESQLPGKELSLYPNPANHFVTLKSNASHNGIIQVQILNSEGKLFKNFEMKGNTEVDVREFPAGLYFVKAGDEVGKLMVYAP
ncbi:MAG: hypothetical protein K0S32_2081 [Bacteroidetes bacterium]|nr:hypothetical protein [Bacteroidota bacterium]